VLKRCRKQHSPSAPGVAHQPVVIAAGGAVADSLDVWVVVREREGYEAMDEAGGSE
jgi:hypothetical protein